MSKAFAAGVLAAMIANTATAVAVTSASYDLRASPFRYAGEYEDRTCGAYNLRARWYLPAQQAFLSRDPADPLHRYGYTAGNPIGRSDPTGLYSFEEFTRDVGNAVHTLSPWGLGYIEPLLPVVGQVFGSMQAIAGLSAFWHPTAQTWVNVAFLVAGAATETSTATRAFDRAAIMGGSHRRALAGRGLVDLGLGVTQSTMSSLAHGRFDAPAFVQGVEYTAGSILTARVIGGIGYRPFHLSAQEVAAQATKHLSGATEDVILVYRVRTRLTDDSSPYTTPYREMKNSAKYHERTIGFQRATFLSNELVNGAVLVRWKPMNWNNPAGYLDASADYAFAGAIRNGQENLKRLAGSPLGHPRLGDSGAFDRKGNAGRFNLSIVRESPGRASGGQPCQLHAAAVRKSLGLK